MNNRKTRPIQEGRRKEITNTMEEEKASKHAKQKEKVSKHANMQEEKIKLKIMHRCSYGNMKEKKKTM